MIRELFVGLCLSVFCTSAIAGICDRNTQIVSAIVAAVKKPCDVIVSADLQSVTHLDLSNKQLGKLSAIDFEGLTGLAALDLSGNGLSENDVPPDTFTFLSNLKSLSLRENRFIVLEWALFEPLRSLESLDLSSMTAFRHGLVINTNFPGRDGLDTKYCGTVLRNLKSLDLSENSLKDLGSNAAGSILVKSGLDSLEKLRLAGNDFGYFVLDDLQYLKRLVALDVSESGIRRFIQHSTLFAFPVSLRYLDLDGNELGRGIDIAELLMGLTELKVLNIGGNPDLFLDHPLTRATFASTPNIESLSIMGNEVEFPNGDEFSHLTRLKSVYLGRNMWHELRVMNTRLFEGLSDLEFVAIEYSKQGFEFETQGLLPTELFKNHPKLRELELRTFKEYSAEDFQKMSLMLPTTKICDRKTCVN